jgi:hypothetical protein
MILTYIGTGLIVLGGIIATWQYRGLVGKEVAQGRVTELEPGRSSGKRHGTVYRTIGEFSDSSGQLHVYRASFSSNPPDHQIGDSIRISFDRNHPADCRLLSFGYRFGIAWVLMVVGISLLAIHFGFVLGNQWLEQHFPVTVGRQVEHRLTTIIK